MADEATPTRVVAAEALAGMDAAAFRREIMAPCQPVVLRGVARDWLVRREAAKDWSRLVSYLSGLDAGHFAEAFVGAPTIAGRYHYGRGLEGFNFQRESLSVGQALQRIEAAAANPSLDSIYLGSLPADDYFPDFAADNPLGFLPSVARPRLWLGNASHVACHYDAFDNLACVVAGRRRFTLYPPDTIGDLYVGPIDHTMAGQPVALAASAAPDDPRYPRFAAAKARALVIEVAPGDGLYLPKLWWHQVEALEPRNLLVNYWWDGFAAGSDAPYAAMMLAMITLAERPEAERKAWRAFFDHYVFRPKGHPLAHLPEEKRGALGSLTGEAYGRIRAVVMRTLRGG